MQRRRGVEMVKGGGSIVRHWRGWRAAGVASLMWKREMKGKW